MENVIFTENLHFFSYAAAAAEQTSTVRSRNLCLNTRIKRATYAMQVFLQNGCYGGIDLPPVTISRAPIVVLITVVCVCVCVCVRVPYFYCL